MSTTIPDLWSNDISVEVVSPLTILRAQEGLLAQRTQGILKAQVASTAVGHLVQHRLDLIAPALGNYQKTLLTAKHHNREVYPVIVQATALDSRPTPLNPLITSFRTLAAEAAIRTALSTSSIFTATEFTNSELQPDQRIANTQQEFIDVIREVLQSGPVRSLLQSLIARSNETERDVAAHPNG